MAQGLQFRRMKIHSRHQALILTTGPRPHHEKNPLRHQVPRADTINTYNNSENTTCFQSRPLGTKYRGRELLSPTTRNAMCFISLRHPVPRVHPHLQHQKRKDENTKCSYRRPFGTQCRGYTSIIKHRNEEKTPNVSKKTPRHPVPGICSPINFQTSVGKHQVFHLKTLRYQVPRVDTSINYNKREHQVFLQKTPRYQVPGATHRN